MRRNRPQPDWTARLCRHGLAALALLAACEADRYPVGSGLPQGSVRAPDENPPVPPIMPPQPVPRPPEATPMCRLPGAPMATRALTISAFSLAERLSRFVWLVEADTAFLQKVTRLAPATTDDVGSLTREMLDDPRNAGVFAFYRKWLEIPDRPMQVPGGLWTSMQRETEQLVTYLTRFGGSFPDLLQVPFSFLNAQLAQQYGAPIMGAEFRRVELNPAERGGVLTHGSWLSGHQRASQRGLWINGALYCRPVPPPPDTQHVIPDPDVMSRWRDQLELATLTQAVCASCHSLLDPPGFLYEHYDSIGGYRTSENAHPVFARAFVQLPGFEGTLEGAAGLAKSAAGSCEAQACFARQWLTAAAGVEEAEQAEVDEVAAAFRASRLGLRDLIVAVTQSRLFLRP